VRIRTVATPDLSGLEILKVFENKTATGRSAPVAARKQ